MGAGGVQPSSLSTLGGGGITPRGLSEKSFHYAGPHFYSESMIILYQFGILSPFVQDSNTKVFYYSMTYIADCKI